MQTGGVTFSVHCCLLVPCLSLLFNIEVDFVHIYQKGLWRVPGSRAVYVARDFAGIAHGLQIDTANFIALNVRCADVIAGGLLLDH